MLEMKKAENLTKPDIWKNGTGQNATNATPEKGAGKCWEMLGLKTTKKP